MGFFFDIMILSYNSRRIYNLKIKNFIRESLSVKNIRKEITEETLCSTE